MTTAQSVSTALIQAMAPVALVTFVFYIIGANMTTVKKENKVIVKIALILQNPKSLKGPPGSEDHTWELLL